MIPDAARERLEDALGERVRFGVPLSRHTSLRVGGPAGALATPANRNELAQLLGVCSDHRIEHAVLGSGFNTLVLDGGFDGVVIRMSRWRRLEERPGHALRTDTGVSHAQVTNFCVERGLSGLEFACGIPGSVGGWVAMNAGIPGRETCDVLREVEVMSPTGTTIRHMKVGDLRFAYRALRGLAAGSLILSALFEVEIATPESVRAEVERLLALRGDAQPLNLPSCGSVFKNPPGDFAGRLIESVGLKGRAIGGAQISPMHANFITNSGGATAGDVLALIEEAQKKVFDETGVRLVPEVRIVGRGA
ncbi:MAG: UDP-N-acetylmuramate dehydrogenase [Myxococcota bacterium]